MKKYAFLVASAVVCASASVFADVAGENVFGVMAVQSGTEYTLVAVPWCECSAENDQPVAVSNIVKTANLEVNDMAYVVDGTGKFNAWKLQAGSDSVLYWNSVGTVSLEGIGTLDSNVATAARGSAIIIYRQHPKDKGNPKTFYLFGQVGTVNEVAVTVEVGKTALIAPPYYAADGVNILDTNKAVFTPFNGDRIMVRKAASGASREYTYDSSDSKWYYNDPANSFAKTEAASIVIPCGLGAWYKATTSEVTIAWRGVPTKN